MEVAVVFFIGTVFGWLVGSVVTVIVYQNHINKQKKTK